MPLALAIIPQVADFHTSSPSDSPAGRSTGDNALGRNLSDGAGQVGVLAQCEAAAGGLSAVNDVLGASSGSASSGAASLSSSSSLGIYGKNASPGVNDAASALVHRFMLQSAARRLLPLEAVAGCLRRRQGGRDTVDLWHLPEVMGAKYGGLQTCSSVWHCPVCAAKITERRRLEVRAGIDAWKAQGGDVALVTLTVRHNSNDNLRGLVAGLMNALRRVPAGKEGQKLKSLGVVGMIRSVELTYGEDNGWHPHIHILVFLTGPMVAFDLLWLQYRKQWENALRLENMKDVTSRGVDMRFANEDVAEYVAKMGHERTWDIEHELAKGPSKLGRGQHFSPIQLLAAFAETGDYAFGQLWQTYAAEMKGTHQLRWSPGLRKLLGIVKKTDKELAAETDKLGVLLAQLDKPQWANVLHFDQRAQLLNVARAGDRAAVADFLADLQCRLQEEDARRIAGSLQAGPSASQELAAVALRREEKAVGDLIARLDQQQAEALELGLTLSEYAKMQERLAAFGDGRLIDDPNRKRW